MEQILRDIASLVGESIVVLVTPIAVTANNASHFLTRVSRYQFWITNGVNGVPDTLNQLCHPLNVLDLYTLEMILGSLQICHEIV